MMQRNEEILTYLMQFFDDKNNILLSVFLYWYYFGWFRPVMDK